MAGLDAAGDEEGEERMQKGLDLLDAADFAEVDRKIDTVTLEAHRVAGRHGAKRVRPPAFQRILVAVDGAPGSAAALDWAAELGSGDKVRVDVVTVLPHPAVVRHYARKVGVAKNKLDEYLRRDQESGKKVVQEAVERLKRDGVAARPMVLRGTPADEIVLAALKQRCDLIIMGSHGSTTAERLLLGSVADSVKNHARCAVLIARAGPRDGPVLIPVDGSAPSRAAAYAGIQWAHRWGAHAVVLHVVSSALFGFPQEGKEEFEKLVKRFGLPATSKGVEYRLESGSPGRTIVKEAAQLRPSVIVMGSRGLGGLRSLVAGGTSNHVSHHAPTSVLLIKA